jgi:putative flippase GtrA
VIAQLVARSTAAVEGRLGLSAEKQAEVGRFLVTGGAAYAADLVVFNALLLGAGMPATWSKVISSVIGIGVAFVGSRWFTWRDRRSDHVGREYALFFLFSVLAAGIQYLFLVVTHDGFGWTSALADNLSANVVGMAVAMAFRFWTFRTYVFPPAPELDGHPDEAQISGHTPPLTG